MKLDPELLALLQALRSRIDAPITITSGFRCETHNANVGGAPRSLHTLGKAADIVVAPTGLSATELLAVAKDVGFKGLGDYASRGFVHVDVRHSQSVVYFGSG